MGVHSGPAIGLSTMSEVVTPGDKAVYPNAAFRSNEQGIVVMMRAIVSFGAKKRIDLTVEIESPPFEHMPHCGRC